MGKNARMILETKAIFHFSPVSLNITTYVEPMYSRSNIIDGAKVE